MSDSQRAVDQLFALLKAQVNSGLIKELNLAQDVVDILGAEGLDTLAKQYSDYIGNRVIIEEDTDTGVTILNPNSRSSASSLVAQPAPCGKGKIPRPPNSFILYRSHHHPLLKARYPGLQNNQISVILGRQWKNEPPSTKKYWQTMSKLLADKHTADHPGYSYCPRKPSEKKRRMKRNGAADDANTALAASASPPNVPAAATEGESVIVGPDFVNTVAIDNITVNTGFTLADSTMVTGVGASNDMAIQVNHVPIIRTDQNGQQWISLGGGRNIDDILLALEQHDIDYPQRAYGPQTFFESIFDRFAVPNNIFGVDNILDWSLNNDHLLDMEKYHQDSVQVAAELDTQYQELDATFDPNIINAGYGNAGNEAGAGFTLSYDQSILDDSLLTLPVFYRFSSEEFATEVL